jgi:hypothetical protein
MGKGTISNKHENDEYGLWAKEKCPTRMRTLSMVCGKRKQFTTSMRILSMVYR